MKKSITTRYFYSTALLLLASITLLGCIQVYLSMGYFKEEKSNSLLNTVNSTLSILKEYGASAATLADTQTIKGLARDILITARASENYIFITDAFGNVLVCNDGAQSDYLSRQFPAGVLNLTYTKGQYTGFGTLGGFFNGRCYSAGKPLLSSENQLVGFVFAASSAQSLAIYLSNISSTFVLSAGLMLVISSVISILLTARMTTPLRRMAEAAGRFGKGDFSVRVAVEGDDELTQLSESFNAMAESLQKIDSSRSAFMGNIAHELRTPMTSIKGFVDGMLDGTIPPESYQHYLAIVSQESGRLTRLIKNMLDITKLEAGEYKVSAANYDVWESITGVAFAAEQRLEEKHIQLSGFAPVRTLVYADPDLVYQVVYNLLDNAVKFTPDGGEIRFSVTQAKGVVTVALRNTGAGISAEALPFVFERFYKEDKSRGLNSMGSGLGLHICKVLINLSGGEIWVDSREGESCEFFFTLPAGAKHTNKKEENNESTAVSESLRELPQSTSGSNAGRPGV